jgi:hypothetical protein
MYKFPSLSSPFLTLSIPPFNSLRAIARAHPHRPLHTPVFLNTKKSRGGGCFIKSHFNESNSTVVDFIYPILCGTDTDRSTDNSLLSISRPWRDGSFVLVLVTVQEASKDAWNKKQTPTTRWFSSISFNFKSFGYSLRGVNKNLQNTWKNVCFFPF